MNKTFSIIYQGPEESTLSLHNKFNCLTNSDYFIENHHNRPFEGSIKCVGAKNLANKIILASCLANGEVLLYNIPLLREVWITLELLTQTGCRVDYDSIGQVLKVNASSMNNSMISIPHAGLNRMSILLLGVLLHRFDRVFVPIPGGDRIGRRNVDFHLDAVKQFGCQIEISSDGYTITKKSRLNGCHVQLPYPSVGATENCLFLAVLARGKSVISNVAIEPEIMELISMLQSMGAIIFVGENRTLIIEGVSELQPITFQCMGDRIEAVTWAMLACATKGYIKLQGIQYKNLTNFFPYFTKMGGGYKVVDNNTIHFYRKAEHMSPLSFETGVFPGLSTDYQPVISVGLTQAQGVSVVHETVYDNRMLFWNDLNNHFKTNTQLSSQCLGSNYCRFANQDHCHSAVITGPVVYREPKEIVSVPDLRAGMAYVMVAYMTNGETQIGNTRHIEVGYGDLPKRLSDTSFKITSVARDVDYREQRLCDFV